MSQLPLFDTPEPHWHYGYLDHDEEALLSYLIVKDGHLDELPPHPLNWTAPQDLRDKGLICDALTGGIDITEAGERVMSERFEALYKRGLMFSD